MINLFEKSKVLIEKFTGKIIIIKYGGSIMNNSEIDNCLMQDIVLMKHLGMKPVIVHGGGNEINQMLDRLGIKTKFIKGLRVTDEITMETAEMVLAGKINKNIVNKLQIKGVNAVGITGKDGHTFVTKQKIIDNEDLGLVGDIQKTNTKLINTLISNDFIPVIAPIGTDCIGRTYNINADFAASSLAVSLKAAELIFLTDVRGVLKNINDKDSLISKITVSEGKKLIENGIISSGMIPKVQNCIEAVEKGVNRVHIIDGKIDHSLLCEIFTDKGIGTNFIR